MGSIACPCRVVVFRGRVSARRPTRFLVARQESGAKKRAPNCPRPFASLRATCVGRDAGCAAELTPCACGAIRSNNCGKSDDEASLSFGRLATPHPAQRRRGQKGGGWGQPTANSQQPTANSQQPTANSQRPTANSRRHRFARLQTGGERSEGPHHLPVCQRLRRGGCGHLGAFLCLLSYRAIRK